MKTNTRTLLIAALLCLTHGLSAAPIVVFGENDFYVVGKGAERPKQVDRAAFFEAYAADVDRHAPLESMLEMISPPEWGKTVSASTKGWIRFHTSFPGGFACHLELENLLPEHAYILTLNGNPSKAGNNLLPSSVPGNPLEKYYDFLVARTDARGHYDANLGIFLRPGGYDVRCYVKDTGDFKIVLYRDFFRFDVR